MNIKMATEPNYKIIPAEYEDIAPYNDAVFKDKIAKMVKDPGFEHAIRYVMPGVDYQEFVDNLLKVENQYQFQHDVMLPFLGMLERATTGGVSCDGMSNLVDGQNYTFITNHRDIVLDASFLNLSFDRAGKPLTQIAIGNNLLIVEWITDLVKLNRSFIVKRDLKMQAAMQAAKQLSSYIHYTINTLHESVWIAQREGRAKDSNDLTQEGLIKMLSLSGDGNVKDNLLAICLCPVSISYEYDPNDYLKAREFLLRKRDPKFKKDKRDDLLSMETGLLKHKGRVMFRVGRCINEGLAQCTSDNRQEIIRAACQLIDNEIHRGYEIYQCNYIAYDELNGVDTFAGKYTPAEVEQFNAYLEGQLDKANGEISDVTPEEREYMRTMMLTMYANPLKNKLAAKG